MLSYRWNRSTVDEIQSRLVLLEQNLGSFGLHSAIYFSCHFLYDSNIEICCILVEFCVSLMWNIL